MTFLNLEWNWKVALGCFMRIEIFLKNFRLYYFDVQRWSWSPFWLMSALNFFSTKGIKDHKLGQILTNFCLFYKFKKIENISWKRKTALWKTYQMFDLPRNRVKFFMEGNINKVKSRCKRKLTQNHHHVTYTILKIT